MSNIGKLSSSSSLKDLVDRQELLTNNIEEQKNTLKEILISKNIEVADSENKLSILIQKVEELKEDDSIAWLFKDGNEKVSFEVLGNGITINKFNFVGSGACSSKKVSVNTINLAEYKTLKVEYGDCTTTKGHYYPVIGFGIAATKQTGDNHLASKASNASSSQFNNANSIVILDISSFNGDYYIDIFVNSYANASLNINIKNIWLEK